MENPALYGIDLENARPFRKAATREIVVDVKRRFIPISAIAEAANVSYRRLITFNPWMISQSIPRGRHKIIIPAGGKDEFHTSLARWEKANPESRTLYHKVSRGDTLSEIAQKYRVRIIDLCKWNSISSRSIIRPGQKLAVYVN